MPREWKLSNFGCLLAWKEKFLAKRKREGERERERERERSGVTVNIK